MLDQCERFIQRVRDLVAVSASQSLLDPGRIDVHSEKYRAVHGRRQRLSAAHPAEPPGQDEFSIKRPAEMFASGSGESFERALHDSLTADVDPGPRSHLAVHRQSETLEAIELRVVVPLTDKI